MSEKMELSEPKNLPDGWEYQPSTNTVICRGCLFRFGAEHPDGDGGGWTCPNCGDGNNSAALRASPAEGEAVAWTNEAQLGFLKEPGYRVVPMAMWAFQHSAHPVALYAAPPRAAVSPPQREEVSALIEKHVFVGVDHLLNDTLKAADAILALYPAGDGREADSLSGEKSK